MWCYLIKCHFALKLCTTFIFLVWYLVWFLCPFCTHHAIPHSTHTWSHGYLLHTLSLWFNHYWYIYLTSIYVLPSLKHCFFLVILPNHSRVLINKTKFKESLCVAVMLKLCCSLILLHAWYSRICLIMILVILLHSLYFPKVFLKVTFTIGQSYKTIQVVQLEFTAYYIATFSVWHIWEVFHGGPGWFLCIQHCINGATLSVRYCTIWI